MILRKAAKSLAEGARIRRRFAMKDPGALKGYKTLILYSAAIGTVGAAAGSIYTYYRLKKPNQEAVENSRHL